MFTVLAGYHNDNILLSIQRVIASYYVDTYENSKISYRLKKNHDADILVFFISVVYTFWYD